MLITIDETKILEKFSIENRQLLSEHHEFTPSILKLVFCSDFIGNFIEQDNNNLNWLIDNLNSKARYELYFAELTALLADIESEDEVMQQLRFYRNRELVWILAHDILNKIPIADILKHQSYLADALIISAKQWLYTACVSLWGTPTDNEQNRQDLIVLGMGKLGGYELNFSSDIDLIFLYEKIGNTVGNRRSISNLQFFTRLGKKLIKVLHQVTVDGFCYRVDMRLRPFGDSGPLVMSFNALEDYYQEQGREWERYAMLKARVIGAYPRETLIIQKLLRPFIYRRYIDFGAIKSLRNMKELISSEVRRRGLENNIKLGAGGIREIEFIVQSFQLIRGGRELSLQTGSLLTALNNIQELQLISSADAKTLLQAYLFLRKIENLIQGICDKQTQELPLLAQDRARIVIALGIDSWEQLEQLISLHKTKVHHIFKMVIGDEERQDYIAPVEYYDLWAHIIQNRQIAEKILDELKVLNIEDLTDKIAALKKELARKTSGVRGREILNNLVPKILEITISRTDAGKTIAAITPILISISSRTAYLDLLSEHLGALKQLIKLCAASSMVAKLIAKHPILLDELLDPTLLYNPLSLTQYRQRLAEYLIRIPKDDLEQQMESLRQFKQTQILKIAAADIVDVMPLNQVSIHLTKLAEAIIAEVVEQAWQQMLDKYGEPNYLSDVEHKGFAVVGYGKLGGRELGYNSDLDLVFLHACPDRDQTKGPKVISSRQFYLKLSQRIIHLFSTCTNSGVLYEVDMRLRPSGSSGLLTSHITSFAEYQRESAWTWEHQALVRARVVYGASDLTLKFNAVRRLVLLKERDLETLRDEVRAMRQKMLTYFTKDNEYFDIKNDRGGISDIEFLAQYMVLAYSHKYSQLAKWSDNENIFIQASTANLLTASEAEQLIAAYNAMRNEIHKCNLLETKPWIVLGKYTKERDTVIAAWNRLLVE